MSDWKLHTPAGVNDILPGEYRLREKVISAVGEVFRRMCYEPLEVPTFEFYDVYNGQGGQISQETMFKFFDDKGRILVLRPDMTTSIARIFATKTASRPLPQRYSYVGSVFRAEQTQGARQREFTQMGVELIGSDRPEADAEVIIAAVEAIKAAGISEFQVEIGQVAFFSGLAAQAGLDADDIEKLRARIDAKDTWGMAELTKKLDLDEDVKELMISLPYLFGGEEVFAKARVPGLNRTSLAALDSLGRVYSILKTCGYEEYISIDLGMLQGIDYYTGLIFKCYTHGVGFPICAGGRYDNLTAGFGQPAGAVGFAMGINRIISVLKNKTDKPERTGFAVWGEYGAERAAYRFAEKKRGEGVPAEILFGCESAASARIAACERGRKYLAVIDSDGREDITLLEEDVQ